jgi:L-lactate dehydrogenase complex protein LldG
LSALVHDFLASAEAAGCTTHLGAGVELRDLPTVRAAFALADTGSVVFAPSPEQGRADWLDAETLVALVPADRILPGLDELFAAVRERMPSALAIVTGPSRTADIEQTLVVGVHGPRELHVVVLEGEPPNSTI